VLRRRSEMKTDTLVNCHEGTGQLACRTVLSKGDSSGVRYMHDDLIEPNASIGEHLHRDDEEVYFVVEGRGTMILDGQRFPIGPGDVSLVTPGHSHGLVNSDKPMRLIVICVKPNAPAGQT
jgi:mannose-6-phosphate isomerase-like protein (cupin superfamily)